MCASFIVSSGSDGSGPSGSNDGDGSGGINGVVREMIPIAVVMIITVVLYWFCVYKKKGK